MSKSKKIEEYKGFSETLKDHLEKKKKQKTLEPSK